MKYKSEIINDILEQRGHEMPALHYESECIEAWINEAKGAYPKLCDYESEWLNYIMENHIGEFPYETITDVTDATVNNVVPLAYKSAILKGQTLVNLNNSEKSKSSSSNVCDFTMVYLKPNTTYTIIFKMSYSGTESNGTLGFLTTDKTNWNVNTSYDGNGSYKKLLTTKSNIDLGVTLRFRRSNVDGDFTISNVIVLEGDYTNKDIPYFTGMQSVKVPVLTTTGKNLFDGELVKNKYYNGSTGELVTGNNNLASVNPIRVNPNTSIVLSTSANLVNNNHYICEYASDGTFIKRTNSSKITTSETTYFIKFHFAYESINESPNIQLEEGTTSTPYEPHKSNILTVNEEVELRGIGDMKDTLDCLTGKVTERVSEIVLDGSQQVTKWNNTLEQPNTLTWNITIDDMMCNSNILSNKLKFMINPSDVNNVDEEAVSTSTSNNKLYIRLNKSRGLTEADVMNNLSQNPITVQYPLATESVKTVDLKITNQDGNQLSVIKPLEGTMHISTNGSPIKPTATLEIPVEAITQNLTSFIEMEE